jgi:hypothetical protein
MKVYGGVELYIHVFFTLALVGGKWSASSSFVPYKKKTQEHNVSETGPVSETLCSFMFLRIPHDDRSPNTQ